MTRTVLFIWADGDPARWHAGLTEALGPLDFRVYPETGNVDDIDYALVWMPPLGALKTLPNLKGIFSIGAGTSHILRDPEAPTDVPIIRLVDEASVRDMAQYAAYWVLHFHRDFAVYARDQVERVWRRHPVLVPERRSVGILGIGAIGGRIAQALAAMDFDVHGWSRRPRTLDGVTCHSGADGFPALLGACDIVVNMLPTTGSTRDILDAGAFARMRRSAFLINMGRGEAVVDEDLLAALDSGQLGGAVLDVFRTEPLPRDHPYWAHPRVWITPHAAGPTNSETAPLQIAEDIRRLEDGVPIPYVFDPEAGY